MKVLKVIGVILVLLVIAFFLGPKVDTPQLSSEPLPVEDVDLHDLESSIATKEAAIPNIKPDNEARIVWYDSTYQKTEYSLVYMHGFSASQEEGDPIHELVSKRYGMNLYLSRLYGHGVDEKEAMLDLSGENLLQSAKEAVAIGQQIGEKVIVMSTSTGGTLSLYLAQSNPAIGGLILYSPNIELFDPLSKILTMPWGLQIARSVEGSNYHKWSVDSVKSVYWTDSYRVEALLQLRAMLDATMTEETFRSVHQPAFAGYYYENDGAQDSTVSVKAIQSMMEKLGTPNEKKRHVAFPNVRHHVMASYLTSQDLEAVKKETFSFVEEVLKMEPVVKKGLTTVD